MKRYELSGEMARVWSGVACANASMQNAKRLAIEITRNARSAAGPSNTGLLWSRLVRQRSRQERLDGPQ